MDLGIDMGGTKVLLGVYDGNGRMAEHDRFSTPKVYEGLLETLESHVQGLEHHDFGKVAAAVPGRLNRKDGLVVAFGNFDWKNVPMRRDISRIVGTDAILENDAKAGALAEAHALRSTYSRVVYVTVSTGIGVGYCVNGKIDDSTRDSEAGQMLFPFEGKPTRWEKFASGQAIVERFGSHLSEIDDQETLRTIASDLGLGVVAVCSQVQAEAVVFGGGAGSNLDRYKKYLEDFLDTYLHPAIERPALLPARFPTNGILEGCRLLMRQS